MKDPLHDFDWRSLYERYDKLCTRFDSSASQLRAFAPTPLSDRELYYELLRSVHGSSTAPDLPLDHYEALLYWKLYSQPAAVSRLQLWFHSQSRRDESDRLAQLVAELPHKLDRDVARIIEAVKHIGVYKVSGMKAPTALPVRTTLLHFLFPDAVPIFDKMVLQTVGINDSSANQKLSVLERYLPVVWELAERYVPYFAIFSRETPIRLIDMALWVSRGGCAPRRCN